MNIPPSVDKPVESSYTQPWWVRELLRIGSICRKIDLSTISNQDIKKMTAEVTALKEALETYVQSR